MRRSLALAAVCLGLARPAAAATFVEVSVEDVARSSETVVRGRVLSAQGRVAKDGRIVTDVEIAVADAWKGSPDVRVRLVVPGGVVGDVALAVDSAPRFREGEEVVVFLVREGPAWVVAGRALGKFRVEGTDARPASGGARVLPGKLAAGERRVEAMPVDELERRVRAAR